MGILKNNTPLRPQRGSATLFPMRAPFLLLVVVLIFTAGCATKSVRVPGQPISTSQTPYTVSALDQIRITLPGGSETSLTVPHEGPLETPAGPVYVRGQSRESALARIRRAYPKATEIRLEEFRTNRVTVLGEVFHQIHTDLGDGPMRVLDAIAAANGFTPLANKRRVRLLRQNAGMTEIYELDLREMMRGGDLTENMLLRPGDVITVPRNFL
jgi:polysaccharide export outer membrane protein